MRHSAFSIIVGALVLMSARPAAFAQAQIDASFPFGSSQAITVDEDNGLVFLGSGAGLLVLAIDPSDPGQVLDPPVAELRLEGFAREIVLTDQHVFVAAGLGGIVRFDRAGFGNKVRLMLADQGKILETWALDVFRVEEKDYVVAGTNDDDGVGRLALVESDTTLGMHTLHQVQTQAPVYTVELDESGSNVTVLAGTSCTDVLGAVLRYDFDTSIGPPLAIPPLSHFWSIEPDNPSGTFVRDIVIDSTAQLAYVAAFTRGIYRLRIDQPGVLIPPVDPVGGPWSIQLPPLAARFDGVDIRTINGQKVIVAALGPAIVEEQQVWGCATVEACDDPKAGSAAASASTKGVAMYDAATGAEIGYVDVAPMRRCTEIAPLRKNGAPLKLNVIGNESPFFIYAATGSFGLQIIEADDSDPCPGLMRPWELNRVGDFNLENVDARDDYLARVDDLVQIDDNLYGGTENGVVGFDVSAMPDSPGFLLEPSMDWVKGPAVFVDGLAVASNRHVIFGRSGQDIGIFEAFRNAGGVWSLSFGGKLVVDIDGDLDEDPPIPNSTRGYGLRVYQSTVDPRPWLVVTNSTDDATQGVPATMEIHGSVVVYALTAFENVGPDDLELIGYFAPSASEITVDYDGYWMSSEIVETGSGIAVLVTYTPIDTMTDLETGAGLMVLQAFWESNPVPPANPLTFEFVKKVPAFTGAPGVLEAGTGGRITVDGTTAYAAFSCNGVAAFDIMEPMDPELLGSWPPSPGATGLSAVHAVGGSDGKMYVTFINRDIGGIGVFNVGSIGSGPIPLSASELLHKTPFNANALRESAQSLGAGPAFFVADGGGGILYVQF